MPYDVVKMPFGSWVADCPTLSSPFGPNDYIPVVRGGKSWKLPANTFATSGQGGVSSVTAGDGIVVNAPTGDIVVSLETPVALGRGGTGATDAAGARSNLGIVNQTLPVPIASGGTNSTSGPAALSALGAFPSAGGTIAGQSSVSFPDASPYQLRIAGTTKSLRFRTTSGLAAIEALDETATASWQPLYLGGSTVSLGIAGTSILSIDASGNTNINGVLGVGSTPPADGAIGTAFADHVVGKFHTSNAYYNGGWKYWTSGATANVWVMDGDTTLYCAPAGTAGATVPLVARLVVNNSSGACFNTSGSWSAISARELKEAVEPYTRGLDALLQLQPVSFRYVSGSPFAPADEPSEPLIGLIAEDVEPYIPEVCGTTTVTIADEEREVQTLRQGDLTYILLNAVKELEARVRELEARPPHQPEILPADA